MKFKQRKTEDTSRWYMWADGIEVGEVLRLSHRR
jgi:hypothetical protein